MRELPLLWVENSEENPRENHAPYALEDISRTYKSARMFALMSGAKLESLKDLLESKPIAFRRAVKYFRPFLPNLSQKAMAEIVKEYRDLKIVRNFRNRTDEGRLYPLSPGQYNDFARRAWLRRGGPKFHQRIITGVKWGRPAILTNGERRWTRVIFARWIGCGIKDKKLVFAVWPHLFEEWP
ncbi:MAG TPA: hypothetical protein VLS90_19415 [Thermodesulfobacteriota bacterium]|nr:hypothetical protein [Thermodesulfobacteriota bacterium]